MTDRPNFIQGRRNVLEPRDWSPLVPTGPPSLTKICLNERSFCLHQFFRHSGGSTLLVLRLVWTPTFDFYFEKKVQGLFISIQCSLKSPKKVDIPSYLHTIHCGSFEIRSKPYIPSCLKRMLLLWHTSQVQIGNLADQLTLFKPWGGRLCPSYYCQPPGYKIHL